MKMTLTFDFPDKLLSQIEKEVRKYDGDPDDIINEMISPLTGGEYSEGDPDPLGNALMDEIRKKLKISRSFSTRINKCFGVSKNFASLEEAIAEKYPEVVKSARGMEHIRDIMDKLGSWGPITATYVGLENGTTGANTKDIVVISNSKDHSMHKHTIPDEVGEGRDLENWAKSKASSDYPEEMKSAEDGDRMRRMMENRAKDSYLTPGQKAYRDHTVL